jgi:ABC-2 type transport system permease protein
MKLVAFFSKTFKENLRDWKLLSITILFAPMFVYLFYAYFNGSAKAAYTVAVLTLDRDSTYSAGLLTAWREIADPQGNKVLALQPIVSAEAGKKMIKNRSADLMLTIPADFSRLLGEYLTRHTGLIPSLHSCSDPANMRAMLAASFCDYTTYGYIGAKTGIEIPLHIVFESAGTAGSKREFDLYFPALLVFSLFMIFFTAGATLIREVEKGTMTRLMLSRLTPFEMIGAVTLNQIIIGVACLAMTYAAGLSVGYRSGGSLGLVLLVGSITAISVIAVSIMTAYFIETMFGLLTVGCFPYFIVMFFSDCLMPLPRFQLFTIAGNAVYLNDILPTAIATRAFGKILNFNATFSDVAYECTAIAVLSMAYLLIGTWLFWKKHMSVAKS